MRIIRYLKNCKVAVLLIVCLLVVQAFTDLALPHYTSDIVDVGIQQSGVEHAATDEMTAKTHDEISRKVNLSVLSDRAAAENRRFLISLRV